MMMTHTEYLKEYWEAQKAAVRAKKRYLSSALEYEARDLIVQLGVCTDHEAYMEKVVPYWERFGYVPEEFWFELSGSRDNVTDPRFMPLDLVYNEIIPYLNNMQIADGIADKSYYKLWFPDVKQAKTICLRVAGIYYDDGMDIISKDDALRLCMDSACEIFIKPTIYTSAGRGITAADVRGLEVRDLEDIFEKTGMNFIVQQKIETHPSLAALSSDSACTIRINSLLMDGEVHICTEAMRVKAGGEEISFKGKGVYNTGILKDGRLCKRVLFKSMNEQDEGHSSKLSWKNAEECGYFDDSYRVPKMDVLRELTKRLHARIARFRFIGWDFTLDRDGDPVLIELNLSPGQLSGQLSTCSPMFGDMTERLLEDFFLERSLEKVQTQGLLVQ